MTVIGPSVEYDQFPLFWSEEKVFLSMGSFVIIRNEVSGMKTVVQLITPVNHSASSFSPSEAKVRVFLPLESVRFGRNSSRIMHGPCQNLTEIIQTNTFQTVDCATIYNVAFVFRPDDVNLKNTLSNVGIHNVFLCRWKVNAENAYERNCLSNFGPVFPKSSFLLESYHKKMWECVDHLRDCLYKCLNSNGDPATKKRIVTGRMSAAGWNYFKRTLRHNLLHNPETNLFVLEATEKKKKTRLVPIFAGTSISDTTDFSMVRIQTASELQALRGVLGVYATSGVARARPKIGYPSRLATNNCINFVRSLPANVTHAGRNTRVSRHNGIDIRRYGNDQLTVVVRYSSVQFRLDTEGNLLNALDDYHDRLFQGIPYSASLLPDDRVDVMDEDDGNDPCGTEQGELENHDIHEGALLQWRDLYIYQVISVGNSIIIECNDTTAPEEIQGTMITVSTAEDVIFLKSCIEEYLFN